MKLIIDDRYLVPVGMLDSIKLVEPIGSSYNKDAKFRVLDEACECRLVADANVLLGEVAEQAVQANAAKKLEEAEKRIVQLELSMARAKKFEELKGQVDVAILNAYLDTITHVYYMDNATRFDVLKWHESKQQN